MIERVVAGDVHYAEAFADRLDIELFPEESAFVNAAVAGRRAEFRTVRACARDALAELGLPPTPLIPLEHGAPSWPDGVVGSMTHCRGYRAAVVAWADDIATIGIDAEPNARLPDGVLAAVARAEELAELAALPDSRATAWDRLLFSAKESAYKAWFPLAGTWLDFEQASITINPDGTFRVRLLVNGPPVLGQPLKGFDGRWIAEQGLLLTTIVVPLLRRAVGTPTDSI